MDQSGHHFLGGWNPKEVKWADELHVAGAEMQPSFEVQI